MSYVADLVGLSSVIGAFFAGIAVSQTKVKEEVYHNVEALGYAVFIPVFFVSVGLEVDFSDFSEQLLFISILTLVAILTKLLGGYFGAGRCWYDLSWRNGFDHFTNWTAKSIDRTTVLFTFSYRDFIKYTYFSTCSQIFYKKSL